MRRINFSYPGSVAVALLLLAMSGCSRESLSPDSHGVIAVNVAFEDAYPGAQKISQIAVIDRVVATVRSYGAFREDQQQEVGEIILRQPLIIVSRPTGRFAEGTLSVPLKEDYSCFVITIDAFENGELTFTGSGVACIFKKEEENPEVTIGVRPVVPPILRTPGADVIVYADVNLLDDATINFGSNRIFAQNLVDFTAEGANAQSTRIKIYEGHNGTRVATQAPYQSVFAMWRNSDYIIEETREEPIQTSGYKLIMIFLPGHNGNSPFSTAEIDSLKRFAANGGRLALIGEWSGFYSDTGRQTFNQLLSGLGIGMTITNVRNQQQELRINIAPHQVMTNVTSIYNNWTGTFQITNPQTAVALALSSPNAANNNQIDIVLAIGKVQQ